MGPWRCAAWLGAGLLLGAAACSDPGSGPGAGDGAGSPAFPRANLVIISLDTLRADATGFSGGPPGLTEALDRLAARSVVFTHARAQAPQTAPSHMSLFTGVYPSVHGVQNVQHGTDLDTGIQRPLIEAAPTEIPTLAEILSRSGYATVGLTDGGNLNAPHGFARGFDEYIDELSGAEVQVQRGIERLRTLRAGDQPYFLFLHTYEIHAPYVAPPEYLLRWAPKAYDGPMKERVEAVSGLPFKEAFGSLRNYWRNKETFGWTEAAYLSGVYKAGVEQADDLLVPFLDELERSGALDDSVLILLSDHGEEFFEHGQWQHDQLYEECLRVPLFVHLPGDRGAGLRVDTPVALIDVLPTVLDLLGLDRDAGGTPARVPLRGVSLASTLLDGATPVRRPILSEYRADRKGSPLYDWQIAVHHEGRKLIQDRYRQKLWWGEGKAPRDWRDHWLFDVEQDPRESTNLAPVGADPSLAKLSGVLTVYLRELELLADLQRLDTSGEMDAEAFAELVKLGYVGGDAEPPVAKPEKPD